MNAIFFWFFSIAMIVCGLAVILGRNPVSSAICFAFCIFFMAALFIMLHAFFLAAVQVLVTAGAVMVLFLFIIMLLDLTEAEKVRRQKVWMGAALLLGLGLLYLVALTLNQTPEGFATTDSLPGQTADATPTPGVTDAQDDTHQIGKLLFTTYVAPFEVTSLLILVATVGVIVLCKQEERPRPGRREEITREAPPVDPKKEPALKS